VFRLVAASEAVREAVPAEVLPVVWVVTLFGGSKFLMVGLSVTYWNAEDHRRELLAVVATAFVALAVTLSLKWGLGLPRPPESAQRYVAADSPVGFPSGHTIAATVVYGGGLVAFDRYREVGYAVPVAGLVVAVALSRVVLGVHYIGDVVAGAVVGVALLSVLVLALRWGPTVVFALAAVCAVPALFVAGDTGDAALALGGSLGGVLGTLRERSFDAFGSLVERGALTVAGLVFLGGLVGVVEAVEPGIVLAGLANLVLACGIVLLPALAGQVPVLSSGAGATGSSGE
jgi:membrane-associated phospholipid phosphatase